MNDEGFPLSSIQTLATLKAHLSILKAHCFCRPEVRPRWRHFCRVSQTNDAHLGVVEPPITTKMDNLG
jgi:hypothetical protein